MTWLRNSAARLSATLRMLVIMGTVLANSSPILPAATQYVSLGEFSVQGQVCPRIVSLIDEEGGNVDWGPQTWLAHDCLDPLTKKYKVCLLLPDGKGGGSITNYRGTLSQSDVGDPAWHPRGRYVVVQAADIQPPAWAVEKPALYRRISCPSVGYNNNLWLVSVDGSGSFRLTNLPPGSGAVRPRFSHRGDQLLWSELISLHPQKWVMKLASFRLDKNGPHLGPPVTLDPLSNPFYETSDFSPDDQSILFSTTATENDYSHLALARLDLSHRTTVFLTNPEIAGRNEFARFSPDGTRIIWASTRDLALRTAFPLQPGEYWMMNADGTHPQRLTYFNQPGAPEYRPSANLPSTLAWSPDGKSFVANLQLRTPSDRPDDFISAILRIEVP